MLRVCDIMTDRVVTVGQDEPVSTAARLLKRHNIGALPVCDKDGRLRGIVTDRDIVLRCVAADSDPAQVKVNEIMSRGVITAGPFDPLDKAVRLMSEDQVRRLPVVDGGKCGHGLSWGHGQKQQLRDGGGGGPYGNFLQYLRR